MRVLLAEDEKELSDALAAILKHANYSVDAVFDGADALDYALAQEYDALILDIMMPKLDGLAVLKKLRQQGRNVPVLFLTAKSQLQDIIDGLDAGADDYLTKPFAMGELLARLRSISRLQPEFSTNMLQYGNLSLNRENFELSTCRGICRLSGKEYQIMELLMRNPGRLISTELFLEKVWGYDAESDISVVWVYLSNLRKKMASIGANVQIKATRGAGYLLEEIT